MSANQPNKILELDKEHLHEVDGVVLDQDCYERYLAAQHSSVPEQLAEPAPTPAPTPVFAAEPQHVGWYQSAETRREPLPNYGGRNHARVRSLQTSLCFSSSDRSGSYGFSYLTSFSTSFLTSWITSYCFSSGSWGTSRFSGSNGTATESPGGFGLELI